MRKSFFKFFYAFFRSSGIKKGSGTLPLPSMSFRDCLMMCDDVKRCSLLLKDVPWYAKRASKKKTKTLDTYYKDDIIGMIFVVRISTTTIIILLTLELNSIKG